MGRFSIDDHTLPSFLKLVSLVQVLHRLILSFTESALVPEIGFSQKEYPV